MLMASDRNALFYLDGKQVCSKSPCMLSLAPGSYEVRAVSGEHSGKLRIKVRADFSHQFWVTLDP